MHLKKKTEIRGMVISTGIYANPGFVNAGYMGYGIKYADAHKLPENSSCINPGMAVPDKRLKDFRGNTLYNGLPDTGAMEFGIAK